MGRSPPFYSVLFPTEQPQDQNTVRRMAKAPDARDSRHLLQEQFLILGPPRAHESIQTNDKSVREALGNGQCVLITGQHLDGPTSMSADDILAWRGSLQHKIQCIGKREVFLQLPSPFPSSHDPQDAHQRIKVWTKHASDGDDDIPNIHKDVTLAAFLQKRKPTDCLNCLDLPVFDLSLTQPSIIS